MNIKTKQRLSLTLASAGVPADTIDLGEESATVSYQPWATPEQIALGASVLAAFDWSDEAQTAWDAEQEAIREETDRLQAVAEAKRVISTPGTNLETRTPCTALNYSLKEARLKINEILLALKSGDPAAIQAVVPLVTGSTPEEDEQTMFWLLDNGLV